METDEQIIARRNRERAVKSAWRSFNATGAAKRELFIHRTRLRFMPVGEIIQSGDLFRRSRKRNDFTLAPSSHIGKPVRRSGSYRTSRPAPIRTQ